MFGCSALDMTQVAGVTNSASGRWLASAVNAVLISLTVPVLKTWICRSIRVAFGPPPARAGLQVTQISRGQTAGGEIILQPSQPLVHNPLTARRSTTAAFRRLHAPSS